MTDNDDTSEQQGQGQESDTDENGNEQLSIEKVLQRLEATETELAKLKKRGTRKAPASDEGSGAGSEKDDERESELARKLHAQETELERMRTKLQRRNAESIAASLNAVDPQVVVRLIDFEELDDAEDEAEVREVIKSILKEKPYLLRRRTGDGGEGRTGPERKRSMNDLLRGARSTQR